VSAYTGVVHRALAASAIVLAVLAAIVGVPTAPAHVARAAGAGADSFVTRTVDALQLAAWIREGARELRVLDLRGDSAYESHHIPSAERTDFAGLDTLASHRAATLVVYSDDDVRDAQAWANLAARGHRGAYVLSGGMEAWMDAVMDPVLHGDSADYVAALSRYFGGVPRADVRGHEPKRREEPASTPASTPVGAFGETARRGC
jgi:rhodanese-related sulfurtransferase